MKERSANRAKALHGLESPLREDGDSPMGAIHIRDVSKCYPIYRRPSDRLKELLTLNRRCYHKEFWALRNISMEIEKGVTFGLVGENGSGKSTLLQLIAGIVQPTQGQLDVRGRVSALLELGSGFNPEFSGRENVFLSGTILGLSRQEIGRLYPEIERFAEIGEFIHQPVKTYSSGMMVRLAFAVAISVDPDILLVDEALAVGDIYFRQRCMRKIHELQRRGVTIVFVSHSAVDIKSLAQRAAWLDHGRLVECGEPDRVVGRYLAAMVERDAEYRRHAAPAGQPPEARRGAPVQAPEVVTSIPHNDGRHGNQAAEILGIAVLSETGEELALLPQNARIVVRISVRARREVALPIVGFLIRNHLGVELAGTNTALEEVELPPFAPGDIYTIDFHLDLPELYPAHFSFTPAVADGTMESYQICDWVENAVTLQAEKGRKVYGFLRLPCQVRVNAAARSGAPVGERR
ncbi:MAG TPA: ABC transporter ATP-binding protein [Terriglobia bacterium]|nr:ABC transporter ATP-binding protein [Terriglobia bacterium]